MSETRTQASMEQEITDLKNQLAKIQVKDCKWIWMEYDNGYVTDCDQFYKSNPSLPKLLDINVKIKFCQYCGGRIEE